ncbi:MAG TPA: cation-translocating P-type ATPase C-terminal domain-containing protein, partial [Candidatus Doudnabacteria bacterium]|nr:cation-translocating P-type ATPase C-terminal domain-containing protein [Candidatus Doudnabacteria bacterium]
PLPITAVQILWLNFVTDGFLTIAYAGEPKTGNLLREPFRKPSRFMLDGQMISRMLPMVLIMTAGGLYLFDMYRDLGDLVKAQTMTLTILAVFQWFNAYNCRSVTRSAFRHLFTNKWLTISLVIVVALQVLAVHWGPFQAMLGTTDMSLREWAIVLGLASSILLWEEIVKFVRRLVVYWQGAQMYD